MSPRAKPLPVDAYVRVSRVGGREHFISPEEQERSARAFAKSHGLEVGEVLTDLDRSGGTLARPGLQRALERVRAGESGGIVVAWLDRLSRDSEQGHRLLREIDEAGGRVYAPEAPADATTPEGELQVGMFLLVAQYQRKRARAGFARARERSIANGIPVNRDAPVGYTRGVDLERRPHDVDGRGYVLDRTTSPVVREVFERRAAGAGPTELGELLERHGVRTSQGATTWSRQAVKALVASRTYLGELRSGDYVNTAAHEPLVDEPTWLAAQTPIPAQARRRPPSEYLLAGVLRCAGCGYAMQGTRNGRGQRVYRCNRRHAGGVCPAPARSRADVVEAAVLEKVRGMAFVERVAPDVDLAPLAAAYEAADRRLEQVLAPDMQDALGEGWAAVVKERRLEREEAGRALGEARARAGDDEEPQFHFLHAVLVDDAGKLDLPFAEKRRLLAEVFPAIALHRDKTLDFAPELEGLSRPGFRRSPALNPLTTKGPGE